MFCIIVSVGSYYLLYIFQKTYESKSIPKAPNKAAYAIRSMELQVVESRVNCIIFFNHVKARAESEVICEKETTKPTKTTTIPQQPL